MAEAEVKTMEALLGRHRWETKELTGKITALKKTATKGEKKRKKEIQIEIALLEADLDTKHRNEIKGFETRMFNERKCSTLTSSETQHHQPNPSDETGAVAETATHIACLDTSDDENNLDSHSHLPRNSHQKKPNRQHMRKARKQAAFDQERREAAELASNMDNRREIELDLISGLIKPLDRGIYHIAADGHCLYNAVADQVRVISGTTHSKQDLRILASTYIREHADDFRPFLVNESTGDLLTSEEFESYCIDLVETPVWGGDIEIRALAGALKRPIHIVQADSSILKMGEDELSEPCYVSYHRHYYVLGAHYNSLRKQTKGEAEEEGGVGGDDGEES